MELGIVHLYYATLNCNDALLQQYTQIISPEELLRANRFLKKTDQQKYIINSALTRITLAKYLQENPCEIIFDTGEHGKPSLKNHALQFNISHSGDYFLLGVSHDAIGVDIEVARINIDYLALAKRFFTEKEFLSIQSAPYPCDAFYRCWTRKEAFIKATGLGLSFGLDNFEVCATEGLSEQSALLSIHGDAAAARQWHIQSVTLKDFLSDCFAAVAIKAKIKNILLKNIAFS